MVSAALNSKSNTRLHLHTAKERSAPTGSKLLIAILRPGLPKRPYRHPLLPVCQ
jgi:hypothetical protein